MGWKKQENYLYVDLNIPTILIFQKYSIRKWLQKSNSTILLSKSNYYIVSQIQCMVI